MKKDAAVPTESSFYFHRTKAPTRLNKLGEFQQKVHNVVLGHKGKVFVRFRQTTDSKDLVHDFNHREVALGFAAVRELVLLAEENDDHEESCFNVERNMMLAFCMGTHARLGSGSMVKHMSMDVLGMIAGNLNLLPKKRYLQKVLFV
jgi:hypothetical protein